jgi:hypothetical protein
MNYLRWVAEWAVVATCVVGCGGAPAAGAVSYPTEASDGASEGAERADVTAEVHKRGSNKLVVMVGPAGGTLELDNGARLVIPAGALAEPVEVTFAEGARTTAFSNHDYEHAFGPTLDVVVEGDLQSPVSVSLPDNKLPSGFTEKDLAIGVEVPSSTQRAVQGQGTATRWDYLTAKAEAGRAVAQLAQVPGYRVQFIVSKNE